MLLKLEPSNKWLMNAVKIGALGSTTSICLDVFPIHLNHIRHRYEHCAESDCLPCQSCLRGPQRNADPDA